MALLAFSGARTKLIAAVEGTTSASRLEAVLQQAMGQHEGHLAAEQADANERVCCLLSPLLCSGPHLFLVQHSELSALEGSLRIIYSHIFSEQDTSRQYRHLWHALKKNGMN